MNQYFTQLIVFACAYALVGGSISITMGYAGLFSIAQAALYGAGAYTCALLEIHLGLDLALAGICAIAVAVVIAVVTGFPAVRLKAEYLVVGSLALQLVATTIFTQTKSLGGADGLVGIPVPKLFGMTLANETYWIASCLVVAVCYVLLALVLQSPWGRLVRAVRDDEVAVAALGKNVLAAKVTVIAISGALAGLAGCIYAEYVLYISPDDFSINISVAFLAVALIGGANRVAGGIVGAIILVGLPELLRLWTLPPNVAGQLQELIYGALLVLFMMFRPQGIIGRRTDLRPDMLAERDAPDPDKGPAAGGTGGAVTAQAGH